MTKFLFLSALLAVGAANSQAALIISMTNPAQSGIAGETLSFTGVLSNDGGEALYLNSVNLNLAGDSFTPDVFTPFFNNVPFWLDPGQSTAEIELLTVLLNDPFTDPPGTFNGSYALVGGIDADAQDVLASAEFSITVEEGQVVVPEPSTAVLASALFAIWGLHRRKHRHSRLS